MFLQNKGSLRQPASVSEIAFTLTFTDAVAVDWLAASLQIAMFQDGNLPFQSCDTVTILGVT